MTARRLSLVLGLGFGDEGKGTVVDWLAREGPPPLVVRWNGGPQAAHHVADVDRVHCFAQLGAASFVAGARTHLAGDMAVDLYALHAELATFRGYGAYAEPEVTVDPRCILVTPWHAIVNRVREALRGAGRHGTTGRGVGEAKLGAAKLYASELGSGFAARAHAFREALTAQAQALVRVHDAPSAEADELLARAGDADLMEAFLDAAGRPLAVRATVPAADHVIFESAQGALLDRDHGFFPHVTPSRITRRAAEACARELGLDGPLETWGVLRAYHTRHGEGPFPSEDRALAGRLPEHHNREDGPAGRFRVGWFDAVLARYAIDFAGPIDRLAITCLDRAAALPELAVVSAWRDGHIDVKAAAFAATAVVTPVASVDELLAAISRELGRRIDVTSWGPSARHKRRS